MSVKDYLITNGISSYKLSKKSTVSEATISQFINGKRGITLDTACKLADALEIPLDEFRKLAEGDGEIES